MKILLHICCAPCAIYPVRILRKDMTVMGYFYTHNIHPYSECLKRKETLEHYAESIGLPVIYEKGYDLEGFLRNVVFREADRCEYCYHARLQATALMAKRGKFDRFTTTLLYSKFQQHERIKTLGQSIGKTVGVSFHYEDFRIGWKEGIEESKALNLYRQQYCGCIYSEKQRYYSDKTDR
jgi:predicted adenine nucleotide alpha hydrolase (AANH) superfamily ATPase